MYSIVRNILYILPCGMRYAMRREEIGWSVVPAVAYQTSACVRSVVAQYRFDDRKVINVEYKVIKKMSVILVIVV